MAAQFTSQLADASNSDTIKVEHIFVFSWSQKWEDCLCKLTHGLLDLSEALTHSIRILGYGIATYLVLLGSSKLIASFRPKATGVSSEDSYPVVL